MNASRAEIQIQLGPMSFDQSSILCHYDSIEGIGEFGGVEWSIVESEMQS